MKSLFFFFFVGLPNKPRHGEIQPLVLVLVDSGSVGESNTHAHTVTVTLEHSDTRTQSHLNGT